MTPDSPTAAPLSPSSARSLLLTVLGELVYPDDAPVWTSALVRMLGGLGVEEPAARRAIARAAAAGWLESERSGRSVRWHLAAKGRQLVEDGLRHSAEFVAEPRPWDGRWLVLFITVPQAERTVRNRLYGALSWVGLGNPSPGVWVSPHSHEVDEVRELVAGFGLTDSALAVVGTLEDVGLTESQIVARSWDLAVLQSQYRALLEYYAAVDPESGEEILFAHLRLLNQLQRFLRLDPRLPMELAPQWVGRDAARLFRDRYARWAQVARQNWHRILLQAEQE